MRESKWRSLMSVIGLKLETSTWSYRFAPAHERGHPVGGVPGVGIQALDLHVDLAAVAHQVEDRVERRHAHAGKGRAEVAARVQARDFGGGHGADQTVPVGCRGHVEVMEDHQLAVPGHVDIQLDAVHAHGEGFLKGGQGVFRRCTPGAAVGKDRRLGHRQGYVRSLGGVGWQVETFVDPFPHQRGHAHAALIRNLENDGLHLGSQAYMKVSHKCSGSDTGSNSTPSNR